MSDRVRKWEEMIKKYTGLNVIFHPITDAMSVYKKKSFVASYDDAIEIDPSTARAWGIVFDLKCRTQRI